MKCTDDEIVFMLTPHIVRGTTLSPLNLREIDTGTGSNIQLRRADQTLPVQRNSNLTAPPAVASPPPPVEPSITPRGAASSNTLGAGAQNHPMSMQLVPPTTPAKVGGTVQVAVNLSGGQDVFSVPMMLHYDASKLSLINVDSGDFLGHDGQAVALVHRDDGNGMVVVSASRPPGVAGVNGSGSVCLLTFQAKAPGDAALNIVRASVKNSAQQSADIAGSQAWVHVQ